MRLIFATAFALFAASPPAHAALTCQQALDLPEAEESADEAVEAGSTFGNRIFEIDGATISSPALLKAALAKAGNKTPLINGGDFGGWDFAKLDFSVANTCFYTSKMKASRWNGGKYDGLGLIDADLEGATFVGSQMDHVLMRQANLLNVSMAGARLRKGLFDGGWSGSAENWNLTGADMRGFVFACGITVGDSCTYDRNGMTFAQADLTDADISTFSLWNDGAYRGTKLANTRIAPAQIAEVQGAAIAAPVLLVGGDDNVSLTADELGELQRQYEINQLALREPSFPCAKAMTKVEQLICGEYMDEVRRSDRHMAALYAMIRPKTPSVARSQSKWLASRNACSEHECLRQRYEARITELQAMLDEPEILKPGEAALFIGHPIDFPTTFHSDALFRKITPILVTAAMSETVLIRDKDGSYRIEGEAIGGNAHLCSVGGEKLQYEAKSGWFTGPSDEAATGRAAVFRWFDDRIEFPGNGHPDENFPGSAEYASCGMRAILSPMTRIAVSPALLAKRRAYFETDER